MGKKAPQNKSPVKAADAVASPDAGAAVSAAPATGPLLTKHLEKVHAAMKIIADERIFKDIAVSAPLHMGEGGQQHVFAQKDCTRVLSQGSGQIYKCGASVMWQDLIWLANHRVPPQMSVIKEIQRFHFKPDTPPDNFPFIITIGIDAADTDVLGMKGALQRLSPPEPIHALLFSTETAITNRVGHLILSKWRKLLLAATFHIEVVAPGEARFWRAQNLRQEAIEHGDVAQLTVRQWVYDVVGFKANLEKHLGKPVGADKIAAAYDTHLKYAKPSDKVSKAFVNSAMTVHTRIFSQPAALQILEWCDEHMEKHANPFKSIYLLQAIVDRAQTPARIVFAVQGLVDCLRMGHITSAEFTHSTIRDYRRSYVEVLNTKFAVKDHMMHRWLQNIGLPSAFVDKIQAALASFENVRAHVTNYDDAGPAVTTWMDGMNEPSTMVIELLEDLVCGNLFDGRYKDAIKTKLTTDDFLEYDSIKTKIQEVKDAVHKASTQTRRRTTHIHNPLVPSADLVLGCLFRH